MISSLASTEDNVTADVALADEDWSADLYLFGSLIPTDEMYITILGLMLMLAVPTSDQLATTWSHHFKMLNTAFTCRPLHPNIVFKWEYMIKILAHFPRYLVLQDRFAELRMDFKYKGEDIGYAILSRSVLQPPANISNSYNYENVVIKLSNLRISAKP